MTGDNKNYGKLSSQRYRDEVLYGAGTVIIWDIGMKYLPRRAGLGIEERG
jgi:hypothetical protein